MSPQEMYARMISHFSNKKVSDPLACNNQIYSSGKKVVWVDKPEPKELKPAQLASGYLGARLEQLYAMSRPCRGSWVLDNGTRLRDAIDQMFKGFVLKGEGEE